MGPTLPNTTNGRAFPSNANDMGRGRRHARHCNGSILLMTVYIVIIKRGRVKPLP